MSEQTIIIILLVCVGMLIGFIVGKIFGDMRYERERYVVNKCEYIIYELENRLMVKTGIPLDDDNSRCELRRSVGDKIEKVISGKVHEDDMDDYND